MTSIVIAAHNEESVIERCLGALASQQDVGELDIIVAANGCTDQTADVARRWGVRVIETEQAGKAAALNLADKVAAGYPRIYLDADIVLAPRAIGRLTAALADDPRSCAAVPTRELDVTGRPLIVKGYTAISSRLPAFRDGLFGRGVIALSRRGRVRFETFPEMIADDLFLDSLFTPQEKILVDTVKVRVATPLHTRDLLRRLVRVRRGNAELRSASREGQIQVSVRAADRSAWLNEVVLRDPRLLPAGVIYAGVTLLAAGLARRQTSAPTWGRDESTR